MKKLIALGISTLSAASIALVAAPAAQAADPIIPAVCLNLPNSLIGSGAALGQATNTLNAANSDLLAKRTALNTSVTNYVVAFADHLKALDGIAGVPSVTQAALNAAGADVTSKATAWGNAKVAQWNAQQGFDLAQVTDLMNTTLNGQLCV